MIEVTQEHALSLEDIRRIKTDSTAIEAGDIFIAINSGNRYVESALEKGARYVICERQDIEDSRVIIVPDSGACFGKIARQYRKRVNPKVIAITGSNGKTSVKDILATLLTPYFNVHKTFGNFNNHLGVPMTICSMPLETEVLIIELGMSALGEIDYLASIALPDIGVITNIGESHLEFLKTLENVFKAKTELARYAHEMVVNGDDRYLSSLKATATTYGVNKENQAQFCVGLKNESGTHFTLSYAGEEVFLSTNLLGEHQLYNVVGALVVIKKMGFSMSSMKESLQRLSLSPMRLEKSYFHQAVMINDAYNASPKSTKAAVEMIESYFPNYQKIYVLGDMLELGENSLLYHQEMIEYVLSKTFSKLYLVGKEYGALANHYVDKRIKFDCDKESIARAIKEEVDEHFVILLKGSRGMKLETMIKNNS